MSTNYIIPTKSVASCEIDATANVANQHEAAAKAFLTQTLGNCGPLGSTPYNPMDYYEEPDWDNAPSEKPDLKRKNNEPFGNILPFPHIPKRSLMSWNCPK